MIRSMTGFARRERQGPWGTLVCELRTVNHRYLETSLRLPEELKALDNEVRQAIGTALRRGKVDANLYLKTAAGTQRSLDVDTQLLDQLVARVDQVRGAAEVSRAGEPDRAAALARRGARRPKSTCVRSSTAALELLREALNELNETRLREGQRIRECC